MRVLQIKSTVNLSINYFFKIKQKFQVLFLCKSMKKLDKSNLLEINYLRQNFTFR